MKFLHLVLKNILNRSLNQFYLHTFLDKPLIVAIIAILLKFDINLQINYFQFCLFLIVFSNLINIAREKSIIKHPLLYLAYFTCIIYAILIIFIL